MAGIYTDAACAGNYLVDLDLFTECYPTSDLDLLGSRGWLETSIPPLPEPPSTSP